MNEQRFEGKLVAFVVVISSPKKKVLAFALILIIQAFSSSKKELLAFT